MASSILTPLSSLAVSKHFVPRFNRVPNSSATSKPLLVYHTVFSPSATKSSITAHLSKINVIEPHWTYSMYPTSHFHSNTHEVLIILKGSAKLLFGGEENLDRVEADVTKGDAIVLPAGMAHRLLQDKSGDFQMLGCYPVGADQWDMCYGKEGEGDVEGRIRKLRWFEKDPIYGSEGPVLEV
ncbi:cupin domain-containing protein [Gloeophyllum trabeum ATCC 11539]|uniref:Cupin domain-containing protein n=1 Tax=Gloeophyllum trabeum (strain ATCC 11539 / FP-39264 / Madison 617) TaxID=670483 RepID=S7PVU5_GLOTA|nr:cupin domain-containing protein [Gloeophyllum trabeum ATCC 11539]EPQ51638.1 cupin domain-containing protein [Gloeophyllum trabeum ATCC 11539]